MGIMIDSKSSLQAISSYKSSLYFDYVQNMQHWSPNLSKERFQWILGCSKHKGEKKLDEVAKLVPKPQMKILTHGINEIKQLHNNN